MDINQMTSAKDKLIYEKVKESYIYLYGNYTEEELMTTIKVVDKIIKKQIIDYAKEQTKDMCKEQKKELLYSIGR